MQIIKKIVVVVIVVAGIIIVGCVYAWLGKPIIKHSVSKSIRNYIEFQYQGEVSSRKVVYNFKEECYLLDINNTLDKNYADIKYFHNPESKIYKNVISDGREEEILNEYFDEAIKEVMDNENIEYEEIYSDCIINVNANQEFNQGSILERYDHVTIRICNREPILKEEFADLALAIILKVQSKIYYNEGSKIKVIYQYMNEEKFSDMSILQEYSSNIYTKEDILSQIVENY